MATGKRRIDRILDPAYLEGFGTMPVAEVRTKREEVREEEALLSYERRLLHARLDILRGERDRRSSGDQKSLVDRLPELLADERQPSRGSFSMDIDPPLLENLRRRVELLASDDTLTRLPELPNDKIDQIVSTIEGAEHELSEQRRKVLVVLDVLTAELGRRYQSGEARPEDVLAES